MSNLIIGTIDYSEMPDIYELMSWKENNLSFLEFFIKNKHKGFLCGPQIGKHSCCQLSKFKEEFAITKLAIFFLLIPI